MIDLHCHILPGVDDGSADEEESCAMARLAVESGVTDIAATPHCNAPDPFYNYADSALHARFARLLRRWAREGTVLQANKGSFFGMFGRRAAAAAHWALADGCLHLIASDAHSPYRRTTRMSDIFDFTADFAAEEIADFLLRQNPADILANRPVYTVREKF